MLVEPTAARGIAGSVRAATATPVSSVRAPRAPLASLLDGAPAISPTIRPDPATGVVVTRWYDGAEVANQIPTPRQLDAYRATSGRRAG